MEAVDQTQFRIFRQIGDEFVLRSFKALRENPPDVAPPKAVLRGMRIFRHIGILMMMPMIRRPPQDTFLGSRGTAESHQELHHAAHTVSLMGKITMISTGDEKHAGVI